jgi:hypothetical protein
MTIAGKHALVTGGGSGVGRAYDDSLMAVDWGQAPELRLFLDGAADLSVARDLYRALMRDVRSVEVLGAGGTGFTLGPEALSPVGFAADEAVLPYPPNAFPGFRILQEYFAFPEKFMFVDLTRMDGKALASGGNRMEVFIYLDRALPELERVVAADSLALGCTPVVNLFTQRCEPIPLSHTATEYRIVPDIRRPGAMEVWSVERVRETRPDGSFRPWRPFYRLTHGDPDPGAPGGFYHVVRRDAAPPLRGAEPGPDAAALEAAQDMSPEERSQMVRGMVDGLAARLATDGGPAADWARLIRALGVLGETERASAILAEAQQVFAGNAADLGLLTAAAQAAGIAP